MRSCRHCDLKGSAQRSCHIKTMQVIGGSVGGPSESTTPPECTAGEGIGEWGGEI